jgi:hypothetical protein
MKLSEYILQPRAARIAHIDLHLACEIEKTSVNPGKQSLLELLGLEDDVPNWVSGGIRRCHLCECDSTHGNCRNPRHIYLGNASENFKDFLEANPDHPRATGSGIYRNPITDECRLMPREGAEELGWVGVTSGKSTYRNHETGECRLMSSEEAEIAGWVHANTGKTLYVNPETGECQAMTREEADRLGWVGFHSGKKRRTVVCPHCGKEGSVPNMNRYHFDNCDQREGSWRWFKAQLKQWSKEQKQLRT